MSVRRRASINIVHYVGASQRSSSELLVLKKQSFKVIPQCGAGRPLYVSEVNSPG